MGISRVENPEAKNQEIVSHVSCTVPYAPARFRTVSTRFRNGIVLSGPTIISIVINRNKYGRKALRNRYTLAIDAGAVQNSGTDFLDYFKIVSRFFRPKTAVLPKGVNRRQRNDAGCSRENWLTRFCDLETELNRDQRCRETKKIQYCTQ